MAAMTDDLVVFLNARLKDDELEQRTEDGLEALQGEREGVAA
jgi:hypothetical protein